MCVKDEDAPDLSGAFCLSCLLIYLGQAHIILEDFFSDR